MKKITLKKGTGFLHPSPCYNNINVIEREVGIRDFHSSIVIAYNWRFTIIVIFTFIDNLTIICIYCNLIYNNWKSIYGVGYRRDEGTIKHFSKNQQRLNRSYKAQKKHIVQKYKLNSLRLQFFLFQLVTRWECNVRRVQYDVRLYCVHLRLNQLY